MPGTSIVSLIGKIAYRIALAMLCLFVAMHLLAAVSMPILQALGDGLKRAKTVQIVSIDEETTLDSDLLTVER